MHNQKQYFFKEPLRHCGKTHIKLSQVKFIYLLDFANALQVFHISIDKVCSD